MPEYEILVAGRLGPVARSCFPEVTALPAPGGTVLNGTVAERDDLLAVLELLSNHGLLPLEIWINPR